MQITVRYFAITRETTGVDREPFTLPDDATAHDAWEAIAARHPRLSPLRPHLRIAVNLDFVSHEHRLTDQDELALIPPVSGGSPRCWLQTEPLDEAAVRAQVERPEAGAVVVFRGVVRNRTGERQVSHLEYEVYPEMATAKLDAIRREIEAEQPACQIAIAHRYGRLEIGEPSVIIAVSSPHRAEAFAACQATIDRLKQDVPIWKKEVSPDGSEWVGMGS
ncbi:MAG: molybdopterin converting factor subunit 1 [Myxococcota bacterium]